MQKCNFLFCANLKKMCWKWKENNQTLCTYQQCADIVFLKRAAFWFGLVVHWTPARIQICPGWRNPVVAVPLQGACSQQNKLQGLKFWARHIFWGTRFLQHCRWPGQRDPPLDCHPVCRAAPSVAHYSEMPTWNTKNSSIKINADSNLLFHIQII